MFDIECSAITYIGLVRDNNEDNYYINGYYKADSSIDTEGYIDKQQWDAYIYAVCDGMGGENFGEKSSMIAVETLKRYQSTDIRETINEYIYKANDIICDEMIENGGARSGTTLALLYIRDGKAFSYNVGDSRIYFYRKGNMTQLSEDHTEAERMIKMGMLTRDEARTHRSRNKLTQNLGIFPDEMIIEPYVSKSVNIEKDDMFIVCSDGLTDMVTDEEIKDILSIKNCDTTGLIKRLARATQTNGAKDNVTIILVKMI